MLGNMFYCFRLQKVIECLVLKGPLQLFNPLSPLYRGGSQVFHSDLQKVSLAICKARNGNQSFFFFPFQVVEEKCIHFVVCTISNIVYTVVFKYIWEEPVCGQRVLDCMVGHFSLTQFSLMRLNLPPRKQL